MVPTEQAHVCMRALHFLFNIADAFLSYARKRKRARANVWLSSLPTTHVRLIQRRNMKSDLLRS